jgi:hypothetical protein
VAYTGLTTECDRKPSPLISILSRFDHKSSIDQPLNDDLRDRLWIWHSRINAIDRPGCPSDRVRTSLRIGRSLRPSLVMPTGIVFLFQMPQHLGQAEHGKTQDAILETSLANQLPSDRADRSAESRATGCD